MAYPIILSFDVGVIHLAYCLITKKEFTTIDGKKKLDWEVLEWNNIDLTNRDEIKCFCGNKAIYTNTMDNIIKYYCKVHCKTVDTTVKDFNECKETKECDYLIKSEKKCCKTAKFHNNEIYACSAHSKQIHKTETKLKQLKKYKIKSSTTLNFDDVKMRLLMELDKRHNLLIADYVVIENQPSFKNPRMKSIATTIYDFYLIRGIVDKSITNSKILQVKFMSPSNKLKLANEGDTKQLIKVKKTDETASYKLTKSLGIKYCLDLTSHLDQTHFNSHKKKDDLADAFLQGVYFYTNSIN
jgi:hypothetical protein